MQESQAIEFYSGIAWIPYCLLFCALFYEQFTLRRYPQYIIILFLLCGNIFRCIWFLGSYSNKSYIGYLTVNRLAILFQFSALSLLILMWARILKVSSTLGMDRPNALVISPMAQENAEFGSSTQPNSDVNNIYFPNPTVSNAQGVQRKEFKIIYYERIYLWSTIVINILVWVFMLTSIILSVRGFPALYNVNILLITFLCLAEALIIFFVGLSTGLRISRELSPVFLNVRANSSQQDGGVLRQIYSSMRLCFSSLGIICVAPDTYQLHSQAKAVQKLLRVSSVIGLFFILRSVCFAYRVFAVGYVASFH